MAYITLPNWSMRLHLDVTVHSQSIANNTTTFRALLRVQDPYNNWPHNLNANSMSWSVRSPNGTTHRSGSGTFDFRQYEWLTLSDTHITFGHNADGKFTARQWTGHFSNSGPIGSGVVTINSVSAPTIPRATTPSWSGNFVTGTAKSISLPRPASSGFTHDVAYRFGTSGNYTNIATGAGDTATWTPGHALATNFPNATYGTGQIRVITKSGSTTVGTKTASFRVDAAGSIVPTISSVTWDDNNSVVKTKVGAFVQGQSLVKGTVTAAGAHGSTIKAADRTLIIGGQTLRESELWQPTTAGTITASGRVLDSRSRVGTLAADFTVLPYSPPSISNGLTIVQRATNSAGAVGEGSFLRMDLTAAVSSLKPSTAEKNTFHLRVRTRPVGGAWTTRNNGVLSGLSQSAELIMVKDGAAFPTATSFEVEIRVTDALGNYSEVIRRVATIAVSLDLADTGIGVGKLWERGGLDVQGDIYSDGALVQPPGVVSAFAGVSAPNGWLLCQGQEVSRATYSALFALLGTRYGAGNGSSTFNIPNLQGRLPVGLSSGETEFDTLGKTGGTKTHTLTTSEMPSHNHGASTNSTGAHTHRIVGGEAGTSRLQSSQGYPGGTTSTRYGPWFGGGYGASDNVYTTSAGAHTHTVTVNSSGSGNAHNNLQPYAVMNYIIKL